MELCEQSSETKTFSLQHLYDIHNFFLLILPPNSHNHSSTFFLAFNRSRISKIIQVKRQHYLAKNFTI